MSPQSRLFNIHSSGNVQWQALNEYGAGGGRAAAMAAVRSCKAGGPDGRTSRLSRGRVQGRAREIQ